MKAFLYSVSLQWKLDLRNRGVFITYYVVPLVFFAFMGGIFTSIDPNAKNTLIQSMTVFGVTMGAFLGAPVPLALLYGSDVKKSYQVGGIPLWVGAVNHFLSAFIHLLIMSLVIYIIAPVAFDAAIPKNLSLYFISLAIFIAVCLSVGTALGLLVNSTSKLTMVSQLLFLPSIMLSGIMFPLDLLPKILESIGKIFPVTWGYQLMTSDHFDIALLIPLLIIFVGGIAICGYRLSRIGRE